MPGDVLLTGFSDMPIARLMTLPLTTGTEDVAPPIFLTYYTFSKGVSLDFPLRVALMLICVSFRL